MKADLKANWISALRSGDYVQGRVKLKTIDELGQTRHCCLGVLCEVLPFNYNGVEIFDDYIKVSIGDNGDSTKVVLSVKMISDLGMEFYHINMLMRMNDDLQLHKNFNEISDWIEKNVPSD